MCIYCMVKNIDGKELCGKFGKLQVISQTFFTIFTAFDRISYGFTLPMAKHA